MKKIIKKKLLNKNIKKFINLKIIIKEMYYIFFKY